MKKNEIKEIYDRSAERYSNEEKIKDLRKDASSVLKYFLRRKIEATLQLGKFKKEDKILEIGSGLGQYTTLLAERDFQMVGIDLSDKSVEIARENAQI